MKRKNRNNIRCLILLLSVCFLSCKEKINVKIVDYVEKNCVLKNQKDGCIVDLKSIIDFEWDTLYVFPSWSMTEDIANALGLEYNKNEVKGDTKRIILVKDGKIIKDEDYSVWGKYGLIFEYTDWPNQIIKYSASRFIVRKIQNNNTYFYKLEPL